jgi:sulfate adenylyltransferase subunit 2
MMDFLDQLEAEAIYILRETAAQFQNPVLLFSGGKDSICLVHLAKKAFYPHKIPFSLLHIDTGHNFQEALDFRDVLVQDLNLKLFIRFVAEDMSANGLLDLDQKFPSRNTFQTISLLKAIELQGFDACIGGARRDEEKARAKERIFSHRNLQGKWLPEAQGPEVWRILNGSILKGENMRVFPLSNWTEIDVWQYILREKITLPSLYFAHSRPCFQLSDGSLMCVNKFVKVDENDVIETRKVRYRTVGDMTCTAAIESNARTVSEVIEELIHAKISERGATRIDDRISDAGMEDRKKEGYF